MTVTNNICYQTIIFLEAFIQKKGNASNLKTFYQADAKTEKKAFRLQKKPGLGRKSLHCNATGSYNDRLYRFLFFYRAIP